MSNSLREQLLKAGLVDEKKLKAEKRSQHNHRKQKGKSGTASSDSSRRRAEEARRAKAERDRRINRERQLKLEKKAARAQVRELIEGNRFDRQGAEIAYHFVHRGKVKKLYVTAELHRQLVEGRLAVVRLDGRHEVVTRAIAEKIRERDDTCIMSINDPGAAAKHKETEDDSYAGFEVPDDLMW
ncbi:MAG: DUF2058 domain-containing protein [Proteobacteria bacterium]|nr:MAG: DUF2058 domain-containing protein [Pseudomonadota bacterium]